MPTIQEIPLETTLKGIDTRIKEAWKGNYLSVVDRLLEERYRLVHKEEEEK